MGVKRALEKRLTFIAKHVLYSELLWDTAIITRRKNKEIVYSKVRNTLDLAKINAPGSLVAGIQIFMDGTEGFVIRCDSGHAFVLDPDNGMHRKRFVRYFLPSVLNDRRSRSLIAQYLIETNSGQEVLTFKGVVSRKLGDE